MARWQVLGDHEVFRNEILRLHLERIRTPEGRETDWSVVDVVDGAAVMPIAEDGGVWMVRQYRQTARKDVWEFPAGRLEPGEGPEAAARRELREEAGLEAGELEELGPIWPLDGIVRHRIHLFVAKDLATVPTAHETFEDIVLELLPRKRFLGMVADGEIDDGVALALWARARARAELRS